MGQRQIDARVRAALKQLNACVRFALSRSRKMFRRKSASETFAEIKGENLNTTILYPATILLLESIPLTAVGIIISPRLFQGFGLPAPYTTTLQLVSISIIPFTVIAGLVTIVLTTLIFHISLCILGGKGGIEQTFKAVAYGLTPSLTTMILPPIQVITIPWSLIIISTGIRELHQVSRKKSILAIILPIITVVGIGVIAIMV